MHAPQRSPSNFQRQVFGALGLALLIFLYLLPGSIGHDPWRGDDVRNIAVIHGLLQGEGWLFPAYTDDPATGFPPLYHWVGALFAFVFGGLLPFHDAARLATPLFTALAIFWIARAAARLYGRYTGTPAALLTLGTLGLVIHAHESQPMLAVMAMQAMTLAGLAKVPEQPVKGALQAAAGLALSVLAGGPIGLLLTLPLFPAIILCCPECHNARASGALILALSVGAGAGAVWPALLAYHAPESLALWWQYAWAGFAARSLGFSDLPRLLELLGWFTWPLWPIALWALWRAKRQPLRLRWMLPLASGLLAGAWVIANGDFSPAAMLPLIPPLALLAAAGVPTLRRGAANAFDWFAVMTFAVFGVLIWLAWSAQAYSWPPGLARSLARMGPEFVLHGTHTQATLGIAITLAWLALVWNLPRSPNRAPANWAIGMTMLWCLTVTLLLPWVDYSRNYRPMAGSLAFALAGEQQGCVAEIGLSSSHRAAFRYFVDLRVIAVSENQTACRYLLVHDDQLPTTLQPGVEWQQIWEYRHAGGKRLEVFQLYRRD